MDFLTDTNNLLILGIALISGGMLLFPNLLNRGSKPISATETVQSINQDQTILIDIRPLDRYKSGHIAQAKHILAADLVAKSQNWPKDKTIILVCDTGRTAQRSASELRKAGFSNVRVLENGIVGWIQAGLPTKAS